METWMLVVIAVVVVAAVAAVVAWVAARQRRKRDLKGAFGPEYDREVARRDDARAAESELAHRRERRAELDIHPLPEDARRRYVEAWRHVQERFVDRPTEAVRDADELVQRVMADRGYPVEDFEQRAADLSVDHPTVVENYRSAHRISSAGDGEATTEDLRKAMVHYRSLFNELLEAGNRA